MAVADAKRFLEEYMPGSELGKAVKSTARKEGEPLMAFYARAAAEHGFYVRGWRRRGRGRARS